MYISATWMDAMGPWVTYLVSLLGVSSSTCSQSGMYHVHLRMEGCRTGPTLRLGGLFLIQLLRNSSGHKVLAISWSEALYLPGPHSSLVTAFGRWQSSAVDCRDYIQKPRGLHCDSSIWAFHKIYTLPSIQAFHKLDTPASPTIDASSTIGSPESYDSIVKITLPQPMSFC